LREALLFYQAQMERDARRWLWEQSMIYAVLAPWAKDMKAPEVPAILKE
jgi:hypothetical protein